MALDRKVPCGHVGVVTTILYNNYGNRLQNYAMQRIINGFGFACTTIVNTPKAFDETREGRPSAPRSVLGALVARSRASRLRRRLFGGATGRDRIEVERLRDRKLENGRAFTRAHIVESDFKLYRDTPAGHLDAMYDYFVAGSDQIWNPDFRKLSEVGFLTFASRRKRIAFSASMGVSEIPHEFRAFYRQRLSDFEHISVREEAAAAIVRGLTGREVPVTIDPTLMFGADDWTALAKRHPGQPETKYLLTYFLGPRSEACRALIDRCVARWGLGVVHLNDPAAREFYVADPAEFLGLIKEASLVCTDSFHGVIFSVIFGIPFLIFDRTYRSTGQGSRLDTLLATLQLEHRKVRDELGEAEFERLLEPDFAHVRPILDARTAQARAYLAHAFGQAGPAPEAREAALPTPA